MTKTGSNLQKSLNHPPATPPGTSNNDSLSAAFEQLVAHNPDRMTRILHSVTPNHRKRVRCSFEIDSAASTVHANGLTVSRNQNAADTSPILTRNGTSIGSFLGVPTNYGNKVNLQLQDNLFDNQEMKTQHAIRNGRTDNEAGIEANPSDTSGKQIDQASTTFTALHDKPMDDDAQDEKTIFANACQEWAMWILGPRRQVDPEPPGSNTISIRTKLWYLQNIFKNRMLVATQEKLQLFAGVPPNVCEWLAGSLNCTSLVFASYMSKDVAEGLSVAMMDGAIDRMATEFAHGLSEIYLNALQISRESEDVDVDQCSPLLRDALPEEHPLGITEHELESELKGWDFDDSSQVQRKNIAMQNDGHDLEGLRQIQDLEDDVFITAAKRQKLNHQDLQNCQSMNAEIGAIMKLTICAHDHQSSSLTSNPQQSNDKIARQEDNRNVCDEKKKSKSHPQAEMSMSFDEKREVQRRRLIEGEQVDAIATVLHDEGGFHTQPDPTIECSLTTSPPKHLFADLTRSGKPRTHLIPTQTCGSTNLPASYTGGGLEDEISLIPTSPEIPIQELEPIYSARKNIETADDSKNSRLRFGLQNKPSGPVTPAKKSTKELFARVKERENAKGQDSIATHSSPTPGSDWSFGQMQLREGSQPSSVKKSAKPAVEMLGRDPKTPEKATKARKSRPLKSTFDLNHKAQRQKVPDAVAFGKGVPASAHSYQAPPTNFTSPSNLPNGFLYHSAISPEERTFQSPHIHPINATPQNFGSPPHYNGPPITGAGLTGPPAHLQMTGQPRNHSRNHTHSPHGNPNLTVIDPLGIARGYNNYPQMTLNIRIDNMSATSRRFYNPNSPESFSPYNLTTQSPTPSPHYSHNHNHAHTRRSSYPYCSQPMSPERPAAIPFHTPRRRSRRVNRETVTVTFPSASLCDQGRNLFHEAVRTNPAFRGLASEADWNNAASELKVTAPAGSNLRGLLIEMFPHFRLSASMK